MKNLFTLSLIGFILLAFVPLSAAQESPTADKYGPIGWETVSADSMAAGEINSIENSPEIYTTGSDSMGTTATLTVIHAIPGLEAPVDIFADGDFLFSFDFYQSVGPLPLPEKTYFIEVKLLGDTVLSGDADLVADKNYTAIAHLVPGDPDPGIKLSFFENDVGNMEPNNTRVVLRHTADAPAVDVAFNFTPSLFYPLTWPYLRARGLSNDDAPGQFGAVDLPFGFYGAIFYAAGTNIEVLGTAQAPLLPDTVYAVYVIGSIDGGSLGLFVQIIDL